MSARQNPVSVEMRAAFTALDRIWKHPQYEGKAVCSQSFDLASRYEALLRALGVFAEQEPESIEGTDAWDAVWRLVLAPYPSAREVIEPEEGTRP